MKIEDMAKLTNKLEEIKLELKKWNSSVPELNFEVFENTLVVKFEGNDFDHMMFDLLTLENSRRVDDSVWMEF